MLKIRFPSDYNQNIGLNTLLVKYSSGLTLKDKFLFFILKMYYRGLRLTTRLALGEKKRKNLPSPFKIVFMDLMAKFVGKGNMIVEVLKYGYKSYCRTWSNFNDLI